MPAADTDAFLTWLFLPTHFALGWIAAGFALMSGVNPDIRKSGLPDINRGV